MLYYNIMEDMKMPKKYNTFHESAMSLLYAYALGEIDRDEFDEKMDELAYYQNDVRSSVDAYYAGIA